MAVPTAAFGSPLIVWLGPRRYAFPPGRDVTVGLDSGADIRLDGGGPSANPTLVVLHYNGGQWIAVDRSEAGIYVDGVRMSTVFIHDGRAITLGDPQHGPRLVFQLGAPLPPPPPAAPRPPMRPAAPPPPRPVQHNRPPLPPPPPLPRHPRPAPRPAPWSAPPPPPPPRRSCLPPPPPPAPLMPPPPPAPPPQLQPPPQQPQPESPSAFLPPQPRRKPVAARLTGAIQKLSPRRAQPEPRPHEAAPTTQLPKPADEKPHCHQRFLDTRGRRSPRGSPAQYRSCYHAAPSPNPGRMRPHRPHSCRRQPKRKPHCDQRSG